MDLLEKSLHAVNPLLNPDTTLTQLSEIDPWKAKLRKDAEERLRIAPSLRTSVMMQIREIRQYLEFDADAKPDNGKEDNYFNQFRKIAYEHLSTGDDLNLRQLGYLLLAEHWQRTDDQEDFHCVTIIGVDVLKMKLSAIGEGAAFSYHLAWLEGLLQDADKKTRPAQMTGVAASFKRLFVSAWQLISTNPLVSTLIATVIATIILRRMHLL